MEMELTDERKKRIRESIAFYRRMLSREMAYSPDLQRPELIAEYRQNIARLEKLLTQDSMTV